MLDNHTKYLLNRIAFYRSKMKSEPQEKEEYEYLVGELVQALTKHTNHEKVTHALNGYTSYLLDTIEEFEEDSKEPSEKEISELVISELVQALANYNSSVVAA